MHIISNNHKIPNIILFIILIYCVISYHSVNIFNQSFVYKYLSSILTNLMILHDVLLNNSISVIFKI